MKQRYFRKIRPCLSSGNKDEKRNKGTLTLLSVFLFFVFSTLSLGMIYLTQVYLRISAYRKNSILLDYAAENGIKQGFGKLQEMLLPAMSPLTLNEAAVLELKEDAWVGGMKIVQEILGNSLPIALGDDWEKIAWESLIDFQFIDIKEDEDYFRVNYRGTITATGKLSGFTQEKESSLDSDLGILAGHIPLPVIPMLVDKNLNNEQKTRFLEENRLELLPSKPGKSPPPVSFSGGELLPQDATKQLADALKIKIFRPQDLTAWKLRLALGLEANNEPVPDGVYLIADDMGLGKTTATVIGALEAKANKVLIICPEEFDQKLLDFKIAEETAKGNNIIVVTQKDIENGKVSFVDEIKNFMQEFITLANNTK